MKKWGLEISVFICGAVVMILELVGSRILAPYVGTSVVVWTSLIGVILASLSAGYYFGGRRSDSHASEREFSGIIFISGILVLYSAVAKTSVLKAITSSVHLVHPAAVLAAIALFAPASFTLGMISPYAIKLRMRDLARAGTTSGTLSALSTAGSIAGTFLAGFILIAYFGSVGILYLLACALLLLSIVMRGSLTFGGAACLIIALSYAGLNARVAKAEEAAGVIERDTAYQHVTIYPSVWGDGRPVRLLATDTFAMQSGMYLDGHPDEAVFDYMKLYDLVDQFHPGLKNALLIGGAAYTYPKVFLKRYPEASLDVAEIDAGITDLAREYFSLKDDPRLHIHHQDARMFIDRMSKGRYDAVFIDAFSSFTPPPQLTTVEAAQDIYGGLSDDGVVLINIASAIEGDDGRMFRAEFATYKSVFPHVYAFRVDPNKAPDQLQSIVLVALKDPAPPSFASDDPEMKDYLQRLWHGAIPEDVPPLTDDYAPVERYLMGLYRATP